MWKGSLREKVLHRDLIPPTPTKKAWPTFPIKVYVMVSINYYYKLLFLPFEPFTNLIGRLRHLFLCQEKSLCLKRPPGNWSSASKIHFSFCRTDPGVDFLKKNFNKLSALFFFWENNELSNIKIFLKWLKRNLKSRAKLRVKISRFNMSMLKYLSRC